MRVPAMIVAVTLAIGGVSAGQTSPKAAMLEQAGWAALEDGQAQAAADAFGEALTLDARNPWLHLGAGTAAFLQRRDADAQAALQRALDLDPAFTRAKAQLAQVLHRLGDLQGAIRLQEAVLADAPNAAAPVRETLERWRREAELHDRMQMAVGDHFTVSFEGPEDAALAQEALAGLDRAFWRICDVMNAYPPRSVPVVLYSAEQFRDITRSPAWAAAAFDGTIRVPMRGALENPNELERVLAHEFAHALIRSMATRGVPTWLNEGLASVLESDDLAWAEKRVSGAAAVPLLSDLQASFGRLDGESAQVAYATSALAARRLLDEAGGPAVSNLLRDLGEGIAFEEAFLHRLQRSFEEFQRGPVGR